MDLCQTDQPTATPGTDVLVVAAVVGRVVEIELGQDLLEILHLQLGGERLVTLDAYLRTAVGGGFLVERHAEIGGTLEYVEELAERDVEQTQDDSEGVEDVYERVEAARHPEAGG